MYDEIPPLPPTRTSLGTTFKRIVRSLLVPNNASIDDPAIIIGADLPPCIQSRYSSAIMWRPPNTTTASAPYYFIGQRQQPGLPNLQIVEHGFAVYDGVNCEYRVVKNSNASVSAGALFYTENFLDLAGSAGLTLNSQNHRYRGNTLGHSDVNFENSGRLFVRGKLILNNKVTISGAPTGSASDGAGAFTSISTGQSISFTKAYSSTNVRVRYATTWFGTTTATSAEFAVNIDSGVFAAVDTVTHQYNATLPAASAHLQSYGEIVIPKASFGNNNGGAGTYTIIPRFRRTAGATATINTNDWFTLTVEEESDT